MTEHIRYAMGKSTLGDFVIAASDKGVVTFGFGLLDASFTDSLRQRLGDATIAEDGAGLSGIVAKLALIIDHPDREFDVPLDIRGSDYEKRVWEVLRTIPAGQTTNYGAIAARLGAPREAREVAEACAANPIAILIPCHRVVKKDGSLSGYRWGFKRKRELLARERNACYSLLSA
jgi:AraC family transcriptional regulator of adaptative response/methylated-DNA-[protein]-cysteine methyltransferase